MRGWCGVGAGCELEIIMLCPAVPSSVLRGRPGRVGYSGGRGGVIWGRAVYIMLRGEGGGGMIVEAGMKIWAR